MEEQSKSEKAIEDFLFEKSLQSYNPTSLQQAKKERDIDVIENARLGSYDQFGNYIVDEDIKFELLAMPKLVVSKNAEDFENQVYILKSCLPVVGDLFFKFVKSKAEAVLFLTETIKIAELNMFETVDEVLDATLIVEGENPTIEQYFALYNIFEDPDEFDSNAFPFKAENVLMRKLFFLFFSSALEDFDLQDEKAFEQIVQILKSGTKFGQDVLAEFANQVEQHNELFETDKKTYHKIALSLLVHTMVAMSKISNFDVEWQEVFQSVLSVRKGQVEEVANRALLQVEDEFVKKIAVKAGRNVEKNWQQNSDDFRAEIEQKLEEKHKKVRVRPTAPILKQGKQNEKEANQNKENDKNSKSQELKRVSSNKQAQAKGKKLSAKKKPKKSAKKKPKAKVKAKKKVKKSKKTKKKSFSAAKKGAKEKDGKKNEEKKKDNNKKDDKKNDDKKKKMEFFFFSSPSEIERQLSIQRQLANNLFGSTHVVSPNSKEYANSKQKQSPKPTVQKNPKAEAKSQETRSKFSSTKITMFKSSNFEETVSSPVNTKATFAVSEFEVVKQQNALSQNATNEKKEENVVLFDSQSQDEHVENEIDEQLSF